MTTRVKITHDQERYPVDLLVRRYAVSQQGTRTLVAETRLTAGTSTTELYVYPGMVVEVVEAPFKTEQETVTEIAAAKAAEAAAEKKKEE